MTGLYSHISSLIMVGQSVLPTDPNAENVLFLNFVHLIKEINDMLKFFENSALLSSIQSGGLGILIGGIFAMFGFKPPSPDNLAGILGIGGIYLGWVIVGHYIK